MRRSSTAQGSSEASPNFGPCSYCIDPSKSKSCAKRTYIDRGFRVFACVEHLDELHNGAAARRKTVLE